MDPQGGSSMIEIPFKIGHRVRVTDRQCQYFDQVGEVRYIESGDFPFGVAGFTEHQGIVWFRAHEITLAEKAAPSTAAEAVEHPAHYGGADNPYEVIKVAEAWGLDKDAYLFNPLKYIGRAGKKDIAPPLQDLKKGRFYLDRRIQALEEERA
jgi:hypothetical protein